MKERYILNSGRCPLVYSLNTEDVQNIAKDTIGRELSSNEIKKIIEPISENIDWTEAISIAIDQHIRNSQTISH